MNKKRRKEYAVINNYRKTAKKELKKISLAGILLALGLVLPFLTGQLPDIGNMLLPLHLPVLIAGFSLGGGYGMLVGAMLPLLRSLLFGMPALFPKAVTYAFELATYGLVSGFLYSLLTKFATRVKKYSMIYEVFAVYLSLLCAMLSGRVVFGIVTLIIFSLSGSAVSLEYIITETVFLAIPGIILQLIAIPLLVLTLRRAKLLPIH